MRRFSLFPLVALLPLFPLPRPAAATPPPAIPFEKYTLPNGLEVLLSEDHRVPICHVQVWYHVGSKDEQAGKTGFAHLFEHMMFQGSRNIAEDTWFKKLDAVGGFGINGTTNHDRTNYFESVPANQLELALWMESDRMGFLLDHVNDESFRTQQEVVRNERRQSYEMRPYGMIDKATLEALYPPSHPYHHTVIGEHEDLAKSSVEDVKGFFRSHYAPSNATIAIVGDFQSANIKPWVQKYFGTLPKVARPARVSPTAPERPQTASVAMEANVQLPRFVYEWYGFRPFSSEDAAFDLLAMALSDGKSSRLYKRLVYDLRIAQSVEVSNQSLEYGGFFVIDVRVKPGHTLEEARKVVDEELERVRREPLSDVELARAKIKHESRFVRSLESAGGRAGRLQAANHYTGNPDAINHELEQFAAVRPGQILSLAKQRLGTDRRLVVTVVPNPSAPFCGQVIASAKEKK